MKKGKFKLSSGGTSDTYYDLKEAMGEPLNLTELTEYLGVDTSGIDVIIGLDYGGVPLAISLAITTGKPYAILRKDKKDHGTQRRLEGYQKKGRCIIVDDVKTTGKSIEEAKNYLESVGYMVKDIKVLLDRS